MYNILRLLHTIRYLKLIQIYYQIKYRIQNKLDIDQCFIRKYDRLYNLNWKNVEFNLSTYKSDNNFNFININHPFSELIDLSGNVIENDVEGEIVATSYDNTVMPLIRYKTGDYTSYCDFKNKILNKISGKWRQNLLFGYNKEEISITALNLHSEDLDDLLKLQFVQNDYGKVDVLVSFVINKDTLFMDNIEDLLTRKVGCNITFRLKQTNNFIKNLRGKSPLIISKL